MVRKLIRDDGTKRRLNMAGGRLQARHRHPHRRLAAVTVQERAGRYSKLLRVACKQWGKAMPVELSDWWTAEQQRITALRRDRRAPPAEIDDLAARITTVNANEAAALEALLARGCRKKFVRDRAIRSPRRRPTTGTDPAG